jgi:outer membrane lipoprotein SlyB
MRLLILAAATALSLAACKNNDQHDNNMNVDENLTAENIVSNDVTAIDAVTGDAANMAANVNYIETENLLGNEANSVSAATKPRPNREPTPKPKSTTNTAAGVPSNTTTNAE